MIKHNLKLYSWTKLRSVDASYFLFWIKLRNFTNSIINKHYDVNWHSY